MKKNLLTLALGAFAFSASAQNSMVITPDMEATNVRVTPMDQNFNGSAYDYSRGGAIWSEDFGNGWPAGWVNEDVTGMSPWKWSTEGSYGFFAGGSGTSPGASIGSTTANNGFLINDPDSANHHTYGQPSGNTYQYLESWFATPAIPLSGTDPSLVLEFEQFFRFNNDVDMLVQVSSDSTNWTEFNVTGGLESNQASDNPDLVQINISGVTSGQTQVYFRIGWSARVYYWMIDDMRIVPGLLNDMRMEAAYHGDILLDYEYTMIPMGQATEVILGSMVSNQGGYTQPNVMLNYDIIRDGNSVASGSTSISTALAAGQSDTIWYNTGYTPDQVGLYTVEYNVSSDSTDQDESDNTMTTEFEVTEYVMAHETEALWDGQYGGYVEDNTATPLVRLEYAHGAVYLMNNDADLTAIQVSFGSSTSASLDEPMSVFFEVHEIGANIQDILSSEEEITDIHTDGWHTLAFPSPISLSAGSAYILAVRTQGDPDVMTIDGWGVDEDFACANYGPFGAGGAENWYSSWGHSPAIRANFNPNALNIEDQTDLETLGMYPNPANSWVKVDLQEFSNGGLMEIFSSTGQLVKSQNIEVQNGTLYTLDVTDLENGIYSVRVTGDNATFAGQLNVLR